MADKIPWYLKDAPVRTTRPKVKYSVWLIVPGIGRTNRLVETSRGEKVAAKMAVAPYKHFGEVEVESVREWGTPLSTTTIRADAVKAGQRIKTQYGNFEIVTRVVVIPEDKVVYLWLQGSTERFAPYDPVEIRGT